MLESRILQNITVLVQDLQSTISFQYSPSPAEKFGELFLVPIFLWSLFPYGRISKSIYVTVDCMLSPLFSTKAIPSVPCNVRQLLAKGYPNISSINKRAG